MISGGIGGLIWAGTPTRKCSHECAQENVATAANAGGSVNVYISNTVTSSCSEPLGKGRRKGGGDDDDGEDADDSDGGPPGGPGGQPSLLPGMFKFPTT